MPSLRNMMMAGMLFITGVFLTTIACASLFGAVPTAVPPAASPVPTHIAVPLYQQVALDTAHRKEQGQPFGYTISVQTPVLVGSTDPRVKAFNIAMKKLVDDAVATFKDNLKAVPPSPDSTASTFDLHYDLLSPPGNIYSIRFDIQTYYTGAAHPSDTSLTATFDLQTGQALTLAGLFAPSADYLNAIAKYCIDQLNTRDIGFQGFELGATATAQNYRNWNITTDGLMITFDEYQVAPYAAGPQTVLIPYTELAHIIRSDGPLAGYLR